MEPSFDRREDVVGLGKRGVVMESDERVCKVLENGVDHLRSGISLNGEVVGSGVVDDGKFGTNVVGFGVERNVFEVGNARAIDLVVDLNQWSIKESSVRKASDVEFAEKEGEYEFADLVWGKVKSRPWWPGQIIDPAALTDKAMKHLKKDGFVIAYFGDQKFAFNELRDVKPFRVNFCKMESQCSDEAFVRAVNHALREAARRVECGLTCLCVSEEVYKEVKSQIIVNSGIRKESSRIDGGDRFSTLDSFNPAKTVDFLQDLAKDPLGMNRLGVSTVHGQLSAFNRWKGYHQLQVNQVLDDKSDVTNSALHSNGKPKARGRPRKCKPLFNGGLSPSKKVRSMSDLMSNGNESLSDVEYKPKKRGRKRKAVESNGSVNGSQTQTAVEFLSQIYLAAINPIERQHNLDSLVKFSADFKDYRSKKDKNDGFTGTKDSYWTDMSTVTESESSLKPNEENSATSLTFKFTNLDTVPSVKKLHAIYRRFGALLEAETRVLKKKKCVKLVFERKCDAEAAFSSCGKFRIFGPALLSYRLNYFPKLQKTDTACKKSVKAAKKLQFGK
ncbi:putative non-specific serine/threonine protein kinase [Helianthus annuus]|uniref:Non-specific serine/threonine protein kinase n=1 Tax=Helianthus annuus TaxID=4232 RepID=A0A251SKB1_HELAN|nr:serine/threonine-protein kinase ATM [Helianthus annuus]KAF5770347.1 putative non-specific serine/threonine protein kinase [Helianthus annuus]KAJ0465272.1 putative non-specific serine/threonine protein kinase [Helianthus annuus]KAJ0486864.1 putative non-specific serine/threonine protein kinase [Helianthus annuus]KAJ0660997.1 putative non-specific serine/threonine protein kinase [Helianthus annuus]KAJ0855071.1 putative non-specific serine/threonine protein kinase [Helianthus annuus]